MARNYFTLTYTQEVVKLVKISGRSIESVAIAEIPAGIINAGKIERVKLFAELINELKKNAKPRRITSNEVIAAIPEEKVFLKIIEIPKMPTDKIDSAILWQIESIIPFEKKEIYFNWKIVDASLDKLKVLVAVCEKKIIDNLLEALIYAKLKPLIITFPSAGLANLLAPDNIISIIVDLSQKDTILLVVAKNKNIYLSTSRHISSNFTGLERIIHDTVEYYHKKNFGEEIGSILIFGPPILEKIKDRIQSTISEKIKLGNIEDVKIMSHIKKDYISYVDNLGLDLTLEKLSLMPPEIRANAKNETVNYRLSSMINYFLLFGIIIILGYGLFWGKIYLDILKINNQYSNLQQTQTSSTQKVLEVEVGQFNSKIDIIKSIPFAQSIKPSFVEQIVSCSDQNITLKEIKIDATNAIKIKGLAKGRNDLIIFKDKLNATNLLAPINLPISALEKKDNVDFELTSTVIK